MFWPGNHKRKWVKITRGNVNGCHIHRIKKINLVKALQVYRNAYF